MNKYQITFKDRTEQRQYVIEARSFDDARDCADDLPHSDWEIVSILRVKDSEARNGSLAIVENWRREQVFVRELERRNHQSIPEVLNAAGSNPWPID
jgi:hypothetical protein